MSEEFGSSNIRRLVVAKPHTQLKQVETDAVESGKGKDAPMEFTTVESELQQYTQAVNHKLSFDIQSEDGELRLTVYDQESGQVLRVLPREESMAILGQLTVNKSIDITI